MARRLRDLGARPEAEDEGRPAQESEKPRKKVLKEIVAPEFEVSRLHNGQLEFLSLVRVLIDDGLKGRLWPRYSEDHFVSDTGAAIYRRLQTLQNAGREWPSLAGLAVDPALPPAAAQQMAAVLSRVDRGLPIAHPTVSLGNGLEVPVDSAQDFEGHVFDLLESYRITRKATETFLETVNAIADEQQFDPLTGPEIVERAATSILGLRGREGIADALLHFGYRTTKEDETKREQEVAKLFMADRPRFKTGLAVYDEKAGGFQPGEVVLLGGSTGSGKTALLLTLMKNMATMGTSVAMLQLELTLHQIDERLASNLADVDSKRIRTGDLTDRQRERITQAWKDFHDDCVAARSRFTIYAPSASTVQACEYVFKAHRYDVWFIDYVNLIERQMGGKPQAGEDWQRLSDIVKDFKRLAKKYGIAIVLAVQVNIDKESGEIEIRYAKAMKEHSDVVIGWNLTDEAREEGVVWLRHLKARQYEKFDFPVRVALHHCRFESMSQADLPTPEDKRVTGKNRLKRRRAYDKNGEPAQPQFQKKERPLSEPAEEATKKREPTQREPLTEDPDLAAMVQARPTRSIVLDDDDDSYREFDE